MGDRVEGEMEAGEGGRVGDEEEGGPSLELSPLGVRGGRGRCSSVCWRWFSDC